MLGLSAQKHLMKDYNQDSQERLQQVKADVSGKQSEKAESSTLTLRRKPKSSNGNRSPAASSKHQVFTLGPFGPHARALTPANVCLSRAVSLFSSHRSGSSPSCASTTNCTTQSAWRLENSQSARLRSRAEELWSQPVTPPRTLWRSFETSQGNERG